MPRYFFDCYDGRAFVPDQYGIELPDKDEAVDHAAILAQTLLTEAVPTVGSLNVSVMVRALDGSQVYVGHCSFHGLQTVRDDAENAVTQVADRPSF